MLLGDREQREYTIWISEHQHKEHADADATEKDNYLIRVNGSVVNDEEKTAESQR